MRHISLECADMHNIHCAYSFCLHMTYGREYSRAMINHFICMYTFKKHFERNRSDRKYFLKIHYWMFKRNIATGETSQAITSLTIKTFINRQLSSIDNFHQKTTSIKRQLPSKDNFHKKATFINRQLPSIDNFHQ